MQDFLWDYRGLYIKRCECLGFFLSSQSSLWQFRRVDKVGLLDEFCFKLKSDF
jgi:hypothetical protein